MAISKCSISNQNPRLSHNPGHSGQLVIFLRDPRRPPDHRVPQDHHDRPPEAAAPLRLPADHPVQHFALHQVHVHDRRRQADAPAGGLQAGIFFVQFSSRSKLTFVWYFKLDQFFEPVRSFFPLS